MIPRQPRDTTTGANGISAVRNPLRGTVAPRSCPALSRGGDTGVSRSRVVPDPFVKTPPARMTSRHEKERAKQIQEKCQNLLTQMLRDEDNKYCVDCDAKGLCPRHGCAFLRCPCGNPQRRPSAVVPSRPSFLAPSTLPVDIDHRNDLCDALLTLERCYGFFISA